MTTRSVQILVALISAGAAIAVAVIQLQNRNAPAQQQHQSMKDSPGGTQNQAGRDLIINPKPDPWKDDDPRLADPDWARSRDGVLIPGNEPSPDPSIACGQVPPEAVRIYFGDWVYWIEKNDEAVVFAAGPERLLWIWRGPSGRIHVNARIYSAEGEFLMEVRGTEFAVPSTELELQRPDQQEVRVVDRSGRRVLQVRYLNPSAVRVAGDFRYPGTEPIIVTSNAVILGGSDVALKNFCFGDNVGAAIDLTALPVASRGNGTASPTPGR